MGMIMTIDDLMIEFASAMSLGMKAIEAASETYKLAIDKYGEKARKRFAERFPTIRRNTWKILENIGRGRLPPQATMMCDGAVDKLLDAKIPKKKMNTIASTNVMVYNVEKDEYETVPFSHLTEKQADIVLNPVTHSIRTKKQQYNYVRKMESAASSGKRPNNVVPFVVLSDGVMFRKSAKLSFDELRNVLIDAGELPNVCEHNRGDVRCMEIA